jgi:hypothetical protein
MSDEPLKIPDTPPPTSLTFKHGLMLKTFLSPSRVFLARPLKLLAINHDTNETFRKRTPSD